MPRVVRCNVLLILLALISCAQSVRAQHFDITTYKKRVYVPFKLVRSMVVVHLKINGKGPYNFILDTGVGLMLITDPLLIDSLNIVNKRNIKIAGLGERENYEAVVVPALNITISGGLVSSNASAAILKDDFFGLSNYAGMPIHGLLGYAFFSKLSVKINFADSSLLVMRPGAMRIFRKAEKIPLTIEEGKPYITTPVILKAGGEKRSKLLVDLGAGHALSLENIDSLPQNAISANLGVGLNGLIEGHLGRANSMRIGKHSIKNIVASFPSDNRLFKTSVPRDGSLGIGILKRFDVIFDYSNNLMYLKPNVFFKDAFEYNMSGISYHADGKNFEHLIVEKVDKDSPADEVGIAVRDEIISINFKPVSKMTMQQIDDIFKSKDGRTVLLEICRDNVNERVFITLKRRI